ncbi:ParB/RepB/Spo0J family partition protein [Streptomyces sp. NPDC051207]|uniref:ParB/RepB/Spo0J family partition protein n=1 Tax=Streptomyces sp. NPDC051207 TaxID=3154641 RepID=UPI003426BFE4
MSARRQAVAAVTGAPTTGAPDSRLRTLPLEQLVPTRFNPRRRFDDTELLEFGQKLQKKQLQPAVAVTREAYLALWAGEEERVGRAKYVIANGERRYRASLAAGLSTLEVVIDDEVAASRATFLDAVLSENNDREDLDPIERALGIQTMVEQLGGKSKVAEYYGKAPGWVTQQMYLLQLVPELQKLVSTGELPVRETRTIAQLPADQQVAAWQARVTEREAEKAQPRQPRSRRKPASEAKEAGHDAGDGTTARFTAVKPSRDHAESSPSGPGFTAVKPEARQDDSSSGATPSAVPVQRHDLAAGARDSADHGDGQPRRLPYDDPMYVAMHLELKMEPADFQEATRVMAAKCWDKAGVEPAMDLLKEMLATAENRDPGALRELIKRFTADAATS